MATSTRGTQRQIHLLNKEDERWAKRAYRLLERMAKQHPAIHVNEVWDYIEAKRWSVPSNKKVLGIVFTTAAANGLIARTDVAIKVRNERGSYWRPIWRSLVYVKS